MSKESGYGWCQSCGALVFNSQHCHKCGGTVKPICVEIELVKQAKRIKQLADRLETLEYRELCDNCSAKTGLPQELVGCVAKKQIKELEAFRDTVSIYCHPPKDCNDPEVLKTYMKGCFDESQKLY